MICFCASSSELCASHEVRFTFRVQCFRLNKTFSRNGTNRARTYDPLLVRQMLSQLSYDPICSSVSQPTSLLYNHLLTNVNCFFHFFALFFTISRSFHSIPLNGRSLEKESFGFYFCAMERRVEAIADTIFAPKGSSEWFAQLESKRFFFQRQPSQPVSFNIFV